MTIHFDLPVLGGPMTLQVPDALVFANVEALTMLGFSPTVSIDNESERV